MKIGYLAFLTCFCCRKLSLKWNFGVFAYSNNCESGADEKMVLEKACSCDTEATIGRPL